MTIPVGGGCPDCMDGIKSQRWTPGFSMRQCVFSACAGALIANLYYLQPLLPLAAKSFGLAVPKMAALVTVTQLGYAIGLILLVPLADIANRRRLLTILLLGNAIALVASAWAPTLVLFSVAMFLLGISSTAAMVVVPLAVSQAPLPRRGRATGQIMVGAYLSVPVAWVAGGALGDLLGWRGVYVAAAAIIMGLLFLVRACVPDEPASGSNDAAKQGSYLRLIMSLPVLLGHSAKLRRLCVLGMLGMTSFSALWAGLPILLSAPPYLYASSAIGVFGLTAVIGALTSVLFGQLSDRLPSERISRTLAWSMIGAWSLLAFGQTSLITVVVGVAALNLIVIGFSVTQQFSVMRIDEEARSRLNALFIASCFVGASLGSSLATALIPRLGWTGFCISILTAPVLILLLSRRVKSKRPLVN